MKKRLLFSKIINLLLCINLLFGNIYPLALFFPSTAYAISEGESCSSPDAEECSGRDRYWCTNGQYYDDGWWMGTWVRDYAQDWQCRQDEERQIDENRRREQELRDQERQEQEQQRQREEEERQRQAQEEQQRQQQQQQQNRECTEDAEQCRGAERWWCTNGTWVRDYAQDGQCRQQGGQQNQERRILYEGGDCQGRNSVWVRRWSDDSTEVLVNYGEIPPQCGAAASGGEPAQPADTQPPSLAQESNLLYGSNCPDWQAVSNYSLNGKACTVFQNQCDKDALREECTDIPVADGSQTPPEQPAPEQQEPVNNCPDWKSINAFCNEKGEFCLVMQDQCDLSYEKDECRPDPDCIEQKSCEEKIIVPCVIEQCDQNLGEMVCVDEVQQTNCEVIQKAGDATGQPCGKNLMSSDKITCSEKRLNEFLSEECDENLGQYIWIEQWTDKNCGEDIEKPGAAVDPIKLCGKYNQSTFAQECPDLRLDSCSQKRCDPETQKYICIEEWQTKDEEGSCKPYSKDGVLTEEYCGTAFTIAVERKLAEQNTQEGCTCEQGVYGKVWAGSGCGELQNQSCEETGETKEEVQETQSEITPEGCDEINQEEQDNIPIQYRSLARKKTNRVCASKLREEAMAQKPLTYDDIGNGAKGIVEGIGDFFGNIGAEVTRRIQDPQYREQLQAESQAKQKAAQARAREQLAAAKVSVELQQMEQFGSSPAVQSSMMKNFLQAQDPSLLSSLETGSPEEIKQTFINKMQENCITVTDNDGRLTFSAREGTRKEVEGKEGDECVKPDTQKANEEILNFVTQGVYSIEKGRGEIKEDLKVLEVLRDSSKLTQTLNFQNIPDDKQNDAQRIKDILRGNANFYDQQPSSLLEQALYYKALFDNPSKGSTLSEEESANLQVYIEELKKVVPKEDQVRLEATIALAGFLPADVAVGAVVKAGWQSVKSGAKGALNTVSKGIGVVERETAENVAQKVTTSVVEDANKIVDIPVKPKADVPEPKIKPEDEVSAPKTSQTDEATPEERVDKPTEKEDLNPVDDTTPETVTPAIDEALQATANKPLNQAGSLDEVIEILEAKGKLEIDIAGDSGRGLQGEKLIEEIRGIKEHPELAASSPFTQAITNGESLRDTIKQLGKEEVERNSTNPVTRVSRTAKDIGEGISDSVGKIFNRTEKPSAPKVEPKTISSGAGEPVVVKTALSKDTPIWVGPDESEITCNSPCSLSGWFSKKAASEDIPMVNGAPRGLTGDEVKTIAKVASDGKQPQLTKTLLSEPTFRPGAVLKIDDQEFYLGKIFHTDSRDQAIMYVKGSDGKFTPRVLYKSNSDGGWRSTPGSIMGTYSKGNEIHYTQETKPHEAIIKYLEKAEAGNNAAFYKGDLINDYFSISDLYDTGMYTFDKEVIKYQDRGILTQFQKYMPGYLTDTDYATASRAFKQFDYSSRELRSFVPDFSKPPVRSSPMEHTLLGKVNTETYSSQLNGRPAEWVMAYDRDGRVWVDRITFTDSKINSYGVPSEVINSGALTNKPIEYTQQVDYGDVGKAYPKFNSQYVDITPLLDNLAPIQEFRRARNIAPQRIPQGSAPGAKPVSVGQKPVLDPWANSLNPTNGKWERPPLPKVEAPVIASTRTTTDLFDTLDALGGLDTSVGHQTSQELQQKINSILDIARTRPVTENELTLITRTNGLRDKVRELAQQKQTQVYKPATQIITIPDTNSWAQLYQIIDQLGGIQGSSSYYPATYLKGLINSVRNGASIDTITRSGGLRDKVQGLINKGVRSLRTPSVQDKLLSLLMIPKVFAQAKEEAASDSGELIMNLPISQDQFKKLESQTEAQHILQTKDQVSISDIATGIKDNSQIQPTGYRTDNKTIVMTGSSGTVDFEAEKGPYNVEVTAINGADINIPATVNLTKNEETIFIGVNAGSGKINNVPQETSFDNTSDKNNNKISKVKIIVFQDKNNNGKFDQGEKTTPWGGVTITLTELIKDQTVSLEPGWNLITLTAKPSETMTASKLISEIASQGGYATTVSALVDGAWKTYVARGDKEFSNIDFTLQPGKAYFVKSMQRSLFVFKGQRFDKPVNLKLVSGWNAVGFPKASKIYTASTMIDAINIKQVLADAIARFEAGLWDTFVKKAKEEYGENFDIERNRGYILRMEHEKEEFNP